jgi:hypothetical protein
MASSSFFDDFEAWLVESKKSPEGTSTNLFDMFVLQGGPWSQVLIKSTGVGTSGGYQAVNSIFEVTDVLPWPGSKAVHARTVLVDHEAAFLINGLPGVKQSLIKKPDSIPTDFSFEDGEIVSVVQHMYIPSGPTNIWAGDTITNCPRFLIAGSRPNFSYLRVGGTKGDRSLSVNRLQFFSPTAIVPNIDSNPPAIWPLDKLFKLELRFKVGKLDEDPLTSPYPDQGTGFGRGAYPFDSSADAWFQIMFDNKIAMQHTATTRGGDFSDGTVINDVQTALTNTQDRAEVYVDDILIEDVAGPFVEATAGGSGWVKSVEYVEITLSTAGPTSANLTKGQVPAQCFPFASWQYSAAAAIINHQEVDIFFEAGPKVTAERDGSTDTCTVGIFVVEVEPLAVSVQQGTFSMADTEKSDTVAITNVDLTKAFAIAHYKHASVGSTSADRAVRASFSAANQLLLDRKFDDAAVDGHFYIVEALGGEFSVQAVNVDILSATEQTETITAVTTTRTFIVASSKNNVDVDDGNRAFPFVDLQNSTTIRARRPTSTVADIFCHAFVVEMADGFGTVQRGDIVWPLDDPQETDTISAVDLGRSVVNTITQRYCSVAGNEPGDIGALFVKHKFNSTTQIIADRVASGDAPTTTWEVIEFTLASSAIAGQVLPALSQAGSGLHIDAGVGAQALLDLLQAANAGQSFTGAGAQLLQSQAQMASGVHSAVSGVSGQGAQMLGFASVFSLVVVLPDRTLEFVDRTPGVKTIYRDRVPTP